MADIFNNLLSKFECDKILKNYFISQNNFKNCNHNFNIIKYDIKPISDGSALGFLGEYLTLNITAELQDKDSIKEYQYNFFIKSMPLTNFGQRKLIERLGVFSKEAHLYHTLFKDLKKYEIEKWHPNCYYTRDDIMVMDNLLNQNYSHLKEDENLSKDHVYVVLKCIAAMHSNCLIYEEKTGENLYEIYKEYFYEASIQKSNGWFNAGLDGIKYTARVHPKYQNEKYQKFINEKLIEKFNPMYEIVHSEKYKQVLCHRDIWHKNIFFKNQNSSFCNKNNINNNNHINESNNITIQNECVFCDFQHVRFHPPALDVVLFLHLCTNRKFRKEYFDECLHYYYDCLKSNVENYHTDIYLNKLITWEEFYESCEYVKLVCLILSGIYAPLTYIPHEYVKNLQKNNPEKFNQFTDGDRRDVIAEQLEENQFFRNCMFEIVEEIVEYVVDDF